MHRTSCQGSWKRFSAVSMISEGWVALERASGRSDWGSSAPSSERGYVERALTDIFRQSLTPYLLHVNWQVLRSVDDSMLTWLALHCCVRSTIMLMWTKVPNSTRLLRVSFTVATTHAFCTVTCATSRVDVSPGKIWRCRTVQQGPTAQGICWRHTWILVYVSPSSSLKQPTNIYSTAFRKIFGKFE